MRNIDWKLNLNFSFKKPVLALGAELKNTICIATKNKAFISAPLLNLENDSDYEKFINSVFSLPEKLGIEPEIIAYDLHPDFISTKTAKNKNFFPNAKRVGVQHHIAHVASCAAAENLDISQSFIGLAFDGTGYGTDGTMWGGEIFHGSIKNGFQRIARLKPIELPGGAAAINEPWRIALSLAHAAGVNFQPKIQKEKIDLIKNILNNQNLNKIFASSFGRLFDGVAALIGLCDFAEFEAQAAIALEKAAGSAKSEKLYSFPFEKNPNGLFEFNWIPMIKEIVEDLSNNYPKEKIAAAFHDSIAKAVFDFCKNFSEKNIIGAGGVFFNKRLTDNLKNLFNAENFNFILPTKLPPSDAAISLGQAVIANNPTIH